MVVEPKQINLRYLYEDEWQKEINKFLLIVLCLVFFSKMRSGLILNGEV